MTGILRSRADLGAETQREWGDPFRVRTLTIRERDLWGLTWSRSFRAAVRWSQRRRSQSRAGLWFPLIKKWSLPDWEA